MVRIPESNLTHGSSWIQGDRPKQRFESLQGSKSTDVLIIGAGITGLSVGIELLSRGVRVIIAEAAVIGAGTTGGSTGFIDAHPERSPSEFIKLSGIEAAQQLTQLRIDAMTAIQHRASATTDFKWIKAYHYTEEEENISNLRNEFEATKALGIRASWTNRVPLPFESIGYEIAPVARINPVTYLDDLLRIYIEKGGQLFENTIASGPSGSNPTEVEAGQGRIHFKNVVSATHCNYSPALRIYLQTPAYQSYVLKLKLKEPLADALFWNDTDPYFYTRLESSLDDQVILVGGNDHRTGGADTCTAIEELREYVYDRYPVEEIEWEWSAELFEPVDGKPIIGKVPGFDNFWVATGFSGVGLTWGTVSGWILADLICGVEVAAEKEISPSRFGLSDPLELGRESILPMTNLAERILPSETIIPSDLKPGEGKVGKVDGRFVAVSKSEDGSLNFCDPICTHMGGVVHWNEFEQTWDCPVHGGRYARCGKRISSPPENGLKDPKIT